MHRHPFARTRSSSGFLTVGLLLLNGGTDGIPLDWAGPLVALGLGAVIATTAARPRRPTAAEKKPKSAHPF